MAELHQVQNIACAMFLEHAHPCKTALVEEAIEQVLNTAALDQEIPDELTAKLFEEVQLCRKQFYASEIFEPF